MSKATTLLREIRAILRDGSARQQSHCGKTNCACDMFDDPHWQPYEDALACSLQVFGGFSQCRYAALQ
ncbi:MAG: hypothetical protein ACOC7S_00975, partial [Planctomycetota bacterium]